MDMSDAVNSKERKMSTPRNVTVNGVTYPAKQSDTSIREYTANGMTYWHDTRTGRLWLVGPVGLCATDAVLS